MFGLGTLGRRLVESVVGLFALLGFIYVPLGQHTGFEHARAVFSTPAATAAFQELSESALGLRERAIGLVTGRVSPPKPTSNHEPRGPSHEPGPVPPKLK